MTKHELGQWNKYQDRWTMYHYVLISRDNEAVSDWFGSPIKERPNGPERRKQNELRLHGWFDQLEFLLGLELLREENASTVRSNDVLKGSDQESEWQSKTISIDIQGKH